MHRLPHCHSASALPRFLIPKTASMTSLPSASLTKLRRKGRTDIPVYMVDHTCSLLTVPVERDSPEKEQEVGRRRAGTVVCIPSGAK